MDGHFFSFSLEDQLRERPGEPVSAWKIHGKTAIPAGEYVIAMTYSPRFKRVLPELLSVPGFTGIRIHPMNRSTESEGCIGLGRRRAHAVIYESASACDELERLIVAATARHEPTIIRLENPSSS